MATNRNMPGADGCTVQNIDCQNLANRCSKYTAEMLLSATRFTGTYMIEHDMTRITSFLNDLESYIETVKAGPMDLNRTHNQIDWPLHVFPSPASVQDCENENLKAICSRILALWTEVANCQSCDLANGYITFDSNRFLAVINSCRDLLSNLPNPVDMPELSQEIVAPNR
jgi:hypothetical protein